MNSEPNASYAVRRMRAEDLAQVMAMAKSLKDAPQWPQQAYFAIFDPTSAPRRVAVVAANLNSGDVLGFAVAGLLPPQAELESIAVRADMQRRGIGAKLLGELADELRAAATSEILLEVRASNRAGLAFYRSLGWNQVGLRPRYYADPEEDAVLMSLSLG